MPQPPVSHSPLQTAFGFVAIALLVVVTGLGPRLKFRPHPTHNNPGATAPSVPAAPSPAHPGLTAIPVNPTPGVPVDPLTQR